MIIEMNTVTGYKLQLAPFDYAQGDRLQFVLPTSVFGLWSSN